MITQADAFRPRPRSSKITITGTIVHKEAILPTTAGRIHNTTVQEAGATGTQTTAAMTTTGLAVAVQLTLLQTAVRVLVQG